MKFLKDRDDVLVGGASGNNAGSEVLNQLKLVEGFLGETMQETITIVNARSNKTEQEWMHTGWKVKDVIG